MWLKPREAYRQIQMLGFIDGLYKVGKEPNEWYIVCLDKIDKRWNKPEIAALEPEEFEISYCGDIQDYSRWAVLGMKDQQKILDRQKTLRSMGLGMYTIFTGYKYDKNKDDR
jgi:hypothetical protein